MATVFLLKALFLLVLACTFASAQLHPQNPSDYQVLPSLRERASIQDQWTAERVANIPSLLEKYGVQGWLICHREHAEDTIWWSIKNATTFDTRRRTVLFFHTNQSSLAGAPNPLKWIDNTGQVWPELLDVLDNYNPDRIVLNRDENIAFAGGLHIGEYTVLEQELGEHWMKRTVNVPMLAVEFVASRVPGQLDYYKKLQENIWAMLEEGFSHPVVQPGVTTTEDLAWWFREKMQALNVTTWFQPSISIIVEESGPDEGSTEATIQEGDVLHIDVGITAMGMNTDTQHMAYVLKTDDNAAAQVEEDAPNGLKEGLKKSNRMQDIVLANMKPGLTGNAVLRKALDQMKKEGIEGQIYCHPIGDWGHDAGSVMGFTNLPEYVPVLGELPILANTWYSIELFASHFVPERNATLKFLQEEDVAWSEESQTWKFVRGRQERFHLIDARKHADVGLSFVDQH